MLSWLLGKREPRNHWDAETPLFHWNKQDQFTLRDAFEGVCVFGATGSGKTSGSARLIATSCLRHGFGMLVLCTKPDDLEMWWRYCRETGRERDLVVFSPDAHWRFNVLEFEARHSGRGSGLTQNIVDLIEEVLTMTDGRHRGGGGGHGGDDVYWMNARQQLLWNAVDLLKFANEPISIPNLYAVISSIAPNLQSASDLDWQNKSRCYQLLKRVADRIRSNQFNPSDFQDALRTVDFLLRQYPALAYKTRSIVDSTFFTAASLLDRGLLRELFSTTTNVTPLDIQDGKIVVVDLPIESMGLAGYLAGILWKRATQLSLRRRLIQPDTRGVCIFLDEAQSFITGSDAQFLSTCRSKRVASVYLTQSINNYRVTLGGTAKSEAEVCAILANLCTLIAHANACPMTGEYVSSRIGRTRQLMASMSDSHQSQDWFSHMTGMGDNGSQSCSFQEAFEFEVQPSVYAQLRTGGPRWNGIVDAVVFKSGQRFRSTNKNWMLTSIRQTGCV